MTPLSLLGVFPILITTLSLCWCGVLAHRHHDHQQHQHHHHHEHPHPKDISINGTVMKTGCGTPDYSPELINRIIQIGGRKQSKIESRIFSPPPSNITIDTYFCVVIDTPQNREYGDVPDFVLQQQIDVLNENFANSGSLFRFQLNGTQRYTYANGYYTDLDTYIDQLGVACRQGGMDALNIFVVPRIKTLDFVALGVTYSWFATGINYIDGIYILNQAMPGQGFPYDDLGLMAVHETGHWLGLIHPFQALPPWDKDPCNPGNPNDYIADTPQMASATYGCPSGRDSCPNLPGLDPTNNYMDYTNDYDNNGTQCKTMFTPTQVARMQDVWDYYRVQNQLCTTDELSVGIQILFDQSPNATSWDITFSNGTMVHSSILDVLGGSYPPAFASQSINISFCLSIDNYIFNIYNSQFKGFDPPGYFQLSVNGVVLANTGNFSYTLAVPFGSPAPTPAPTLPPTRLPTLPPTSPPSLGRPTNRPSAKPTGRPTVLQPTLRPTTAPPTVKPTSRPTQLPTIPPTLTPTRKAIPLPSSMPTRKPTPLPTSTPLFKPTALPMQPPTSQPAFLVSSSKPSNSTPVLTPTQNPPTLNQSQSTSIPSQIPSTKPTTQLNQTSPPTSAPTKNANFTFGTTTNSTAAKTNKTNVVHINIPAGYCFSEANTVEVENKGFISIKELLIGDKVKDATGAMALVYSFGHYHKTARTEYLQIYVHDLRRPLELSKDHLLYVNGSAVPASLVRVGDPLDLGIARGVAEVVQIKSVARSGAFAPFTTSGTIMVSGVAASNYVTLQEDSNVLMLGALKTPFSMHWLAHVFQSPHRLACTWRTAYCTSDSYSSDGISSWVEGPLHASKWLVRQNSLVMVAVFIPAFLAMLVAYFMEFVYSPILLAMAMIAVVIFAKRVWASAPVKRI